MTNVPAGPRQVLLIATVGGAVQPIAAAVRHNRPVRIRFICSADTRALIDRPGDNPGIVQQLARDGYRLDPAVWDAIDVPNPQDLAGCVETVRRSLTTEVENWVFRGDEFQVICDFTGGTKCMTAALALAARHWPCLMEYVGGSQRDKSGVGVVVDGREQVVRKLHPWTALGYQAAEDAMTLFDQGDFAAAASIAARAKQTSEEPTKAALAALERYMEIYLRWDRFQHKKAHSAVSQWRKSQHHLRHFFPDTVVSSLVRSLDEHEPVLQELAATEKRPSPALVRDLIANACRRKREQRYDDAVAIFYRAVEAYAQQRLADCGFPSTDCIPLKDMPSPIASKWRHAAKDGCLKLGLQDDYKLLADLGDASADRFEELGLARKKSVLSARNQSIRAHGFEPVSEKTAEEFCNKIFELTEIRREQLVSFPRMSAGTR